MRRTILLITFTSLLIFNIGISGVFSAVDGPDTTAYEQSLTNNSSSTSTTPQAASEIIVITTAEIPGASCSCSKDDPNKCTKVETSKYECKVTKGMTAFQKIMGSLIKWFIYIIMLLGVLAIVGAGIMMTFGSDSEEYTKKAKGWAMNIVIGLVILFTFSYILKLLAPWIYQ